MLMEVCTLTIIKAIRQSEMREKETGKTKERKTDGHCLLVCWLLNVPATCECISGTDLHRQFYVLPH